MRTTVFRTIRPAATVAILVTACAGWAQAQDGFTAEGASAEDVGPEFPSDPRAWINSSPLSREALKGKAALLWYFEEGCPRCREEWPKLLAASRKFEGKPVVFIAVNSGNPPAEVLRYARQNRIDWPVLVDTTRAFERQSGVGTISLQNIHQLRVLMPDGQFRRGSYRNVEGEAADALTEARWKVDPASVPQSLRGVWQAVELGGYATAARPLKKALASRNPELKQAAESLHAAIEAEWSDLGAKAREAAEAGDSWQAYKTYSRIGERFRGYDLPEEFDRRRRELETNADVERELEARKRLEVTLRQLRSARGANRQRAAVLLQKLVKDYPGTEAATEAEELLTGPSSAGR